MAETTLPINDDGSASQQDDGSLILGDPTSLPCCCCPTTPCANCTGGQMPIYWGLASDGGIVWSFPTACYDTSALIGAGGPTRWFNAAGMPDPNAARTLIAVAPFSNCAPIFLLAIGSPSGPFSRTYTSPANCASSSGAVFDAYYARYTWTVNRTATKWVASLTVDVGTAAGLILFYGETTIAVGDACHAPVTVTNTLAGAFAVFSTGPGVNWIDCGSGGSVTFTPCAPAPGI